MFLSNLLAFGATTIAAIYKDRWQVELFSEGSTWCTPLDVMEFQALLSKTGRNLATRVAIKGFACPELEF